jgi:MerR family transcriptional regulator, light-induced transcriptional regulator
MTISQLQDLISIGELSKMTGITTHTLRMWEKRYGTPKAHRLPSGHRRYPKNDIPRLRAIVKALDSGYRASKVVTGTLEQLHSLMGLQPFIGASSTLDVSENKKILLKNTIIESWLQYVGTYDDDNLLHSFHSEWGKSGGLTFILDYVVPFLENIGNAWEKKELTIAHEHFAVECLIGFISEKWRQMNVRKNGPKILITTLPSEPYSLGSLMCAVVTSVTNSKAFYLGPDMPLDEIIKTTNNYNPQVVAISISHSMSTEFSEDCLFKLRGAINKKTKVVTGGMGSPCNIPGVMPLSDFKKYYEFLVTIAE